MAKGYFGAKVEAVPHREAGGYEIRPVRVYRPQAESAISAVVDHPYLSAAVKINGMNYSHFMNGLKKAGVTLNRQDAPLSSRCRMPRRSPR